jgi:hypothetical protein
MALNQTTAVLFVSYSEFSRELNQHGPDMAISGKANNPFCVHICNIRKSRCIQILKNEIIAEIKEGLKQGRIDTNTLGKLAKLSLCPEHSQDHYEHLCRQWQREDASYRDIPINDSNDNSKIPDAEPLNNSVNDSGERIDIEIQSGSTGGLHPPESREYNHVSTSPSRPQGSRQSSGARDKRTPLTPAKADAALKTELTVALFPELDKEDAFVYVAVGRPGQREMIARNIAENGPSTPPTGQRTRRSPGRKSSYQNPRLSENKGKSDVSRAIQGNVSTAKSPARKRKLSSTSTVSIPTNGMRESDIEKDDNDAPRLYKVGVSSNTSRRISQIERCCDAELGKVWRTGRLQRWEANRVEKFVKRELACSQIDVECANSDTIHIEWFQVDQKTMVDSVHRWETFMNQKPFDEQSGNMKEFWKNRITGKPSDFQKINKESAAERKTRWDVALNPKWFHKLWTMHLKYKSKRHFIVLLCCLPPPVHLLLFLDGSGLYKAYLIMVLVLVAMSFN